MNTSSLICGLALVTASIAMADFNVQFYKDASQSGRLTLEWPSKTGKTYAVETSSGLFAVGSVNELNQQSTHPSNTWWTNDPGTGESVFYRIRELDPGTFTGPRAAAHRMNQRLHRGNNFMAAKSMNADGALEDYALLNQSRFSHCRIGYKMDEVAGAHPDYTIPASRMQDLQDMVDWCLSQGLIAIVDPVHNWANGPGYTDDDTGADGVDDQVKLQKIWVQVADHFKDYPLDMVVFEIMNEPHGNDDVAEVISIGLGAIRAIPENTERIVIVSGDGFSTRQALIDAFDNDEIPSNDDYLIGTFHYYDPRPFTKQGDSSFTSGITWGTSAEFSEVVTKFDAVEAANSAFATRNSTDPLPIYLGEFGADNEADNWHDDRERWLSWVRMQAEARGFSWAHWNMYSNADNNKGIGPWTSAERTDPTLRTFDAAPLEALIGHYEFEDGALGGGASHASTHPGFSGTGYAAFPEATGIGVWARAEDIYIPTTGTYLARIHYSSHVDRSVRLVTAIAGQNHAVLNNVFFPATGGNNSWSTLEVEIAFPGSNSADPNDANRDNAQLKIVATPDTGPNLDWVHVTAP